MSMINIFLLNLQKMTNTYYHISKVLKYESQYKKWFDQKF